MSEEEPRILFVKDLDPSFDPSFERRTFLPRSSKMYVVEHIGRLFFTHRSPPKPRDIARRLGVEDKFGDDLGRFTKSILYREDSASARVLVNEGLVRTYKSKEKERSYGFYPAALIYRASDGTIPLDFTKKDYLKWNDWLKSKVVLGLTRGEGLPEVTLMAFPDIKAEAMIDFARNRGEQTLRKLDLEAFRKVVATEMLLSEAPPIPQQMLSDMFAVYRIMGELEYAISGVIDALRKLKRGTVPKQTILTELQMKAARAKESIERLESRVADTDAAVLFEVIEQEAALVTTSEYYNFVTLLPNELDFLVERVLNEVKAQGARQTLINTVLNYRSLLAEVRKQFRRYLYRSLMPTKEREHVSRV